MQGMVYMLLAKIMLTWSLDLTAFLCCFVAYLLWNSQVTVSPFSHHVLVRANCVGKNESFAVILALFRNSAVILFALRAAVREHHVRMWNTFFTEPPMKNQNEEHQQSVWSWSAVSFLLKNSLLKVKLAYKWKLSLQFCKSFIYSLCTSLVFTVPLPVNLLWTMFAVLDGQHNQVRFISHPSL